MPIRDSCQHFAKTGLTPPRGGMEKMCLVCPLRNEGGDCIQDIMDDMGDEVGHKAVVAGYKIAEIWRKFDERKKL